MGPGRPGGPRRRSRGGNPQARRPARRQAPATVAAGKRTFYEQMELGVARAYEVASCAISASFVHHEGREGMDAVIDKREPPGKRR